MWRKETVVLTVTAVIYNHNEVGVGQCSASGTVLGKVEDISAQTAAVLSIARRDFVVSREHDARQVAEDTRQSVAGRIPLLTERHQSAFDADDLIGKLTFETVTGCLVGRATSQKFQHCSVEQTTVTGP